MAPGEQSYSLLYYGEADKSLLGFLVHKGSDESKSAEQPNVEVAAKALEEVQKLRIFWIIFPR